MAPKRTLTAQTQRLGEKSSQSSGQLILDVPTFFRPGGLQFRCFISSLITARQFSLDQAYFILLGQRHAAVCVFGHAMSILPLRHHIIQIDTALL